MNVLKYSQAATVMLGPFLDDTDGKTPEGALSIANTVVWLSKNGGDFAYKNDATDLTEDDAANAGWYKVTLNATDTNAYGNLVISVHVAGALPCYRTFSVVPANVYDSLFSTDKLQVDAVELNSSATAAVNLGKAALTMVPFTVGSGSSTTSVVTGLAENTADHYKGKIIQFITGACAGQATDITAYSTGGAATVTALTDAPGEGDLAIII